MSTKLIGLASSRHIILIRIVAIVVGCIAVSWGFDNFLDFWRILSIERTAKRVIAGDAFKLETLIKQVPTLEKIEKLEYCHPADIQSVAIIRLHIVESMIFAGEQDKVDVQMELLRNSIRMSLACSPADPFLWLVLYWMESSKSGFTPRSFGYMQFSYQLGPNEGWVALKRNRLLLSVFQQLPPDVAESATTEFIALLESNFVRDVVNIFINCARPAREQLVLRLTNIAEQHREAFYKALQAQAPDIDMPGIKRFDPHPWH